MTTYVYTALEPSGRKRSGRIEAADEKSALQILESQGRFVTEIKEESAKSAAKASGTDKKKGRAGKADVALYMRRLADLADAGLPLDRALQVLTEQTESEDLSKATEEALKDVRTGYPLSEALAKHPRLFPTIVTMTVAAGEASGQLPQAVTRLAELMEKEVARRSQVVAAMIYPAVLSTASVGAIVFIITFVVPRLQGVFEDMGDALPLPTKLLLGTTNFVTGNWIGIIVGIIVGIFLLKGWLATEAGQLSRDRFYLKAPIFGTIVGKAVISRYARVLGTLVFGGVPILEALKLAGLASANKVYERVSRDVEAEVREGVPIAQALKNTAVFPPVLTNMVAIGEETGDLPRMLNRVSDSMDFEVENGLRTLTSLLEPIIIVTMGVVVAFIVLSIALPIFQAQDLVK